MQLNAGTWSCDVNRYVRLRALRPIRRQLELIRHSAELEKWTSLRLAAVTQKFTRADCAPTPFSGAHSGISRWR
jgi:hypothetical protein